MSSIWSTYYVLGTVPGIRDICPLLLASSFQKLPGWSTETAASCSLATGKSFFLPGSLSALTS